MFHGIHLISQVIHEYFEITHLNKSDSDTMFGYNTNRISWIDVEHLANFAWYNDLPFGSDRNTSIEFNSFVGIWPTIISSYSHS